MREINLKTLNPLHIKIAAAACIASLLAGCAAVGPAVKKTPSTVKTQVLVTLSSPNGKLKKKCVLAWSNPRFRMDIRGFLNEPVAALSADAARLTIYLYQSNLYYDEAVKDAGPSLCSLFSGTAGNPFELKLGKNTLSFRLAYRHSGETPELPFTVELGGKEGVALFDFIKPDVSPGLAPEYFTLKIPANAVRISEDAVMRSLKTWIN